MPVTVNCGSGARRPQAITSVATIPLPGPQPTVTSDAALPSAALPAPDGDVITGEAADATAWVAVPGDADAARAAATPQDQPAPAVRIVTINF